MKTTRRQFLQKTAGTAGALAVSPQVSHRPEAHSQPRLKRPSPPAIASGSASSASACKAPACSPTR